MKSIIKLLKSAWSNGIMIIIASVAIMFLLDSKDENIRLNINNSTLQEDISVYKTKDSLKAIKIGALELKEYEATQYHSDVINALKDLKIKFRKLESLSQTKIESKYHISTTLRDSVILDTIKLKVADYKSKWLDFNLKKINDIDLKINIKTRDSIIQAVYWERTKNLWFIRYGPKRYFQIIKSANPNSEIKYSKYITPVKR